MAFGFTYTLPTITGSHTDLVVMMKNADFPSAAIDGTVNAIDNGGGNLRAYTDSDKLTQLSVEIVKFVSSGSPSVHVRVKIPTASTGNTIFIEADPVATNQPAVGAPFGRNSVWSDYLYSSNDGGVTESSNGYTILDDGSGSIVTGRFSELDALDAPLKRLSDTSVANTTGNYTLTAWHNGVSPGTFLSRRDASTDQYQIGINGGGSFLLFYRDSSGTAALFSAATSGWHKVDFVVTGTNVELFVDGVTVGTATITKASTSIPLRIGFRGDGGLGTVGFAYPDEIGESRVVNSARLANFLATEYDNQSSVGAWGNVGAWVDSAGVSIPVIMYQYRQRRV